MSSETPEKIDRPEILAELKSQITDLSVAIKAESPTDEREQELYLKMIHEYGYLINQYRKLERDTELDQMQEDLKLLMDDTI